MKQEEGYMNLLNYLGTALSISAVLTIISFILGYQKKGEKERQKSYWKMSCVFGGITVVLGIVMLLVMLPSL